MVALIEEIGGNHPVDSALLLSIGAGKMAIIPGATGQVESLKENLEYL